MLNKDLRFDGNAVVVTGAGSSLGRSCALEFARRGAQVVASDTSSADSVVQEIVHQGGIAILDTHSALEGHGAINAAVVAFGAIHVVVNCAGAASNVAFEDTTDEHFAEAVTTRLQGAFNVTRAAWPLLRAQRYGRIVNVSSAAWVHGRHGEAAHNATSLSLAGLTAMLAKEGAARNITVSTVIPFQDRDALTPISPVESFDENTVTSLIVLLCHESATVSGTGRLFGLRDHRLFQTRFERSAGVLLHPDRSLTPEAVLHKMSAVRDFVTASKPFNALDHPTRHVDFRALAHHALKTPSPNPQGAKRVSLTDKVVLVTGAGTGLGRAYALWLARYGATVVVNDITTSENVVAEITASGGTAHADSCDIVTGADQIVQSIVNKYGRIDAVVNNAGIAREKSFAEMSSAQWHDVVQVNLVRTFRVCRAVWPVFVRQHSGSIVNVVSPCTLYGFYGHANDAAAKMGVVGLSETLATEGKLHNVVVNVIAPHAATKMTESMLSAEEARHYSPDSVSPLVVLLCSDKALSGELLEIGDGWIGKARLQNARGALFDESSVSAEVVAEKWKNITNFPIGGSLPTDLKKGIRDKKTYSAGSWIQRYTAEDVVSYNLQVDAKVTELHYVHEFNRDFQAIPTFGAAFYPTDHLEQAKGSISSTSLHVEQYLRLEHWPVPTSATLVTESFPISVTQKPNNTAIVVQGSKSYDNNTGKVVFYNEIVTIRKETQSGHANKVLRTRAPFALGRYAAPLKVKPDFAQDIQTSAVHPTHANTKRPIMPNLTALGIVIKMLLEKYGPIHEIKARFTGYAYHGDRLQLRAWRRNNVVLFQTHDVERKTVVISNAAIKLNYYMEKL